MAALDLDATKMAFITQISHESTERKLNYETTGQFHARPLQANKTSLYVNTVLPSYITYYFHSRSFSFPITSPSLLTMASPWTVDEIPADLTGKTVLITGATAGIGFEAARFFASRKCTLILACRNADKMAAVAVTFKEEGAARVEELVCDLSELESVRVCASSALALSATIDVLLLNAGRGHGSVEDCMVANHLGHFLITGLNISLSGA